MPSTTVIEVDHDHSICDKPRCSHNRWHPQIAPAARIKTGERVEIQTRDSLDGQIKCGLKAKDLNSVSLNRAHPLTGPIYVEGAEPGDVLAVHIDDVAPADHGYTAIFPGLGALQDAFPGPFLLHWELAGGKARSPQLPGVVVPGAPFMGVMGVAPSLDRLARVNRREADAQKRGAVALPPEIDGAVPKDPRIAHEAWRTIAAHELGGNMDVRQLTAGSTLYLPVDVDGALFSVGDAHFAQGDGESCGTAIETSATVSLRFELRKAGTLKYRSQTPSYECPNSETPAIAKRGYLATTGFSISESGVIAAFDTTLAARNALKAMVDLLVAEYSFSPEQAYCIASVAGDLRISSIVGTPHSLVSVLIPKSIFSGD